jgi:hypothetical protein
MLTRVFCCLSVFSVHLHPKFIRVHLRRYYPHLSLEGHTDVICNQYDPITTNLAAPSVLPISYVQDGDAIIIV